MNTKQHEFSLIGAGYPQTVATAARSRRGSPPELQYVARENAERSERTAADGRTKGVGRAKRPAPNLPLRPLPDDPCSRTGAAVTIYQFPIFSSLGTANFRKLLCPTRGW